MKMVIILTIVFGLMAIGMLALKRKRRIKYNDYKCRTIGRITGREPSDDDPANPSEDCTWYEYWWDTGRAEAITFLVLWGIAVIMIALLGL